MRNAWSGSSDKAVIFLVKMGQLWGHEVVNQAKFGILCMLNLIYELCMCLGFFIIPSETDYWGAIPNTVVQKFGKKHSDMIRKLEGYSKDLKLVVSTATK